MIQEHMDRYNRLLGTVTGLLYRAESNRGNLQREIADRIDGAMAAADPYEDRGMLAARAALLCLSEWEPAEVLSALGWSLLVVQEPK